MAVWSVCTERKKQNRSGVFTTNPVYRCEELEDNVSVYDMIDDENEYADFGDEQPGGVYLDLVSDETHQDTKPPLPSPRPETKPQDEDRDFEPLEQKKSDHVYLQLRKDEPQGYDKLTVTTAQDQVQDTETQDREIDKDTELQDQDGSCPDKTAAVDGAIQI